MQQRLHQWLEEDPSHQAEFEEIRLLWDQTESLTSIPFDNQAAWDTIYHRITPSKPASVIKIISWKKAILIAASLMILGAAYYYYLANPKVQWNTYAATDSNKIIQLQDGSTFTLRKGGTLQIPDNYGIHTRMVKLAGECFFQIHHDDTKPFNLSTSKGVIKDIGTSFLMESNDTAEWILVTEGKVSFSAISDLKEPLIVSSGQAAVLEFQKPELKTLQSKNLLAWKNQKLEFDNTNLAQVARDLKDFYNVDFNFSSQINPKEILVTAQFDHEPLSKVIEELNLFT
ncbi:MAG: FecR domain-containing protein, partial [Bacteroidota bacterium]|nr:FecR domain-containing protein [Bacteroidota bacterium]